MRPEKSGRPYGTLTDVVSLGVSTSQRVRTVTDGALYSSQVYQPPESMTPSVLVVAFGRSRGAAGEGGSGERG